MDSSAPPVTIRPSRSDARTTVLPVARKDDFGSGGFSVTGDAVRVQARSGRVTNVARSEVDAVVLTKGPRGDARALLTAADGSVLAQDQATFYSDDALRRLAEAVGCRVIDDPFRSWAELDRGHPGALRYRWERYPALFGLLLGLVICGPILLIALLVH